MKLFAFLLLFSASIFAATQYTTNYPPTARQDSTPSAVTDIPMVVTQFNGYPATFAASISDLSPVSAATHITQICGSSSKTVKVTRIEFNADASAVGVVDVYIYKLSAADTGGTSSAVTAVPYNSSNTATATVTKYTANPTINGSIGLIGKGYYALPATLATGYPNFPWVQFYGSNTKQAVYLKNANECMAIGLNGEWTGTPSGLAIDLTIEWTEE